MLFCAMDFSGDQESGNYKYLSIVVCTEDFLNRFVKDVKIRRTKGSAISKRIMRRDILSKLDAGKSGCLILCIKTDKEAVLGEITDMARKQRKTIRSESLAYAYDNAVMNSVMQDLDLFLRHHGTSLSEIKVEADHDCVDLLWHVGVHRIEESHTHDIADAVAWDNCRGFEPKGVKSMDITVNLSKRLKRKFSKHKPKIKRHRA